LILKVSFVKLFTVLVKMVGYRFITLIDIEFSTDTVVLFVKEINLISELLCNLFVSFLLILHVELFKVLSTLIEVS
jgi:hypothetical protein